MNGPCSYDGVHAKLPGSIDSSRMAAYELVHMAFIPGAVAALARLNIFGALAQAGDDLQLTAAELAARALPGISTVNITYLQRLLRMMCAKKVLREVVTIGQDGAVTERRYALEPIGRFLVDDAKNGSFVHVLGLGAFLKGLDHLHESILDDSIQPFTRAHGLDGTFEYGKVNPETSEVFNKAMAGMTKIFMPALLEAYRGFDEVHVLVDVGGGVGASLGLITARYPHIKGINYDEPHVVASAPSMPGVKHVGGNMFESIPSGGDAIFMKFILHDWGDETCLKILKNCYQALPASGKVIAVDNMLPEIIDFEGGDYLALQIDVHMMVVCDTGGRERTESDLRKLGLAAGFKQVKECLLATMPYHARTNWVEMADDCMTLYGEPTGKFDPFSTGLLTVYLSKTTKFIDRAPPAIAQQKILRG